MMALEPLAGRRVVDLYAGSGALGIEALSRGAGHADFVEPDRAARVTLGANLEALGLQRRTLVWPLELPLELRRIEAVLRGADVVFMDPPYGGGPAREMLERLGAPDALKAGALVVVEHHAKDALPESAGTLGRTRQRRYGETLVSTYRVSAEGSTTNHEEGSHGH